MSHRHRKRYSLPPGEPSALTSSTRLRTVLPGTRVAGRFRLERRIAAGGMGEVWEGTHRQLHLRVAIKMLRSDKLASDEVRARFSREAFLLGRIQSDHVPRVLDFAVDRRFGPVLVTEFIEGATLTSILDEGPLDVEGAVHLGIAIVSGLRELHRAHIVHRDLKPANLLIQTLDDGHRRVVFVDFGVSRLMSEAKVREAGLTEITTGDRAVGTAEYMAPEQILSSRTVTASADLYAVGAILYRAVAGHHIFDQQHGFEILVSKIRSPAPELSTERDDRVARGFRELVARALATSPSDRYESADEMLADLSFLRDAARRAKAPPPRPSLTARTMPPVVRRTRRGRGVLAGAVCLIAGVIVGVLGAQRRQVSPARTRGLERTEFDAERCLVRQSEGETPVMVCPVSIAR